MLGFFEEVYDGGLNPFRVSPSLSNLARPCGLTVNCTCALHPLLTSDAPLLRAGANPNSTSAGGFTALMLACNKDHEACVQALLQANADPDMSNPDGNTALMAACQGDHEAYYHAVHAS